MTSVPAQRPTVEMLRRILRCDCATGKLYWLPRSADLFPEGKHGAAHNAAKWNARWAGREALTAVDAWGYRIGSIFGAQYRAHCVVWALTHGSWPEDQVDHINHDKSNGSPDNLRAATHSENGRNQPLHKNNKSGFNGVSWDRHINRWVARIRAEGRYLCLGRFKNIDDAIAARKAANLRYGYHVNHGRAR